jgi:mRNA-degrading endonuclease toxin of MazEF toxin-antitoxin module
VTASPQRGQVYRCDLGYGPKPWLVVSNNARNRLLDDIIAIRLTTTARDLPTWVKLSPADRSPDAPTQTASSSWARTSSANTSAPCHRPPCVA